MRREGAVLLGRRHQRVQVRRPGAEARYMVPIDSHGTLAVWLTNQAQLLNRDEVVTAVLVDLRVDLLDRVLHSQGVQAIFHSQGKQHLQVQVVQVHPSHPFLPRPFLDGSVPKEELVQRIALEGVAVVPLRVVIDYRQLRGEAAGLEGVVLTIRPAEQQLCHLQPRKNGLELLWPQLAPAVRRDHLRDPVRHGLRQARHSAQLQRLGQRLSRERPARFLHDVCVDLKDPLWRYVIELLEDTLP
mmetsp:Transcript_122088/g.352887  ORF Transcript_122088/g.352887 Transcript_122088/m.352887 type:complete len:243 (-) Transcript_122088:524-1252(-)